MQRYRHLLIPLLVLVVTAAVFGGVCRHDFVKWDDDANIYANPYFNPVTSANILQFWRQPYEGTYRPLAYTAWGLVAATAQLPAPVSSPELGTYSLSPAPFHLFNLLLHLLSVLLVFVILRRLFKHDLAAGAGALLFGIHPLQVETVAWVTGMNDALYTCLGLLALWQYLRFSHPASEDGASKPKLGAFTLATLFFLAALLCKPAAVALPFVALVIDLWVIKAPQRRSLIALGAWVVLGVACAFITRDVHTITNPDAVPPFHLRPLIAGDALAFYLYKLVWPVNMAIDYGRNPGYVLIATHQAYWTWILPVGLGVLLWLLRKRSTMPLGAALVSVAALLPVLGFLPFSFQQFSTVADRYFYLAMLGPALLLAWLLSRQRGRLVSILAVIVLCLLGVATSAQVMHWRDTVSLFRHALAVNPDNYFAHLALGESAENRNDLNVAVDHYLQALKLNPNSWTTYGRLGLTQFKLGNRAVAIECWTAALKLNPNYDMAKRGLAVARRSQTRQ